MLARLEEATQQNFDQSCICTRTDDLLYVEEPPAQAVIVHPAQKISIRNGPVVHRGNDFLSTCCSCLLLCFACSCLFRHVY